MPESSPPVASGFCWRVGPAGRVLVSEALDPLARHAFTTRSVSFRGPSAGEAYDKLAASLGVASSRLMRVRQVHARAVHVVPSGAAAVAAGAAGISHARGPAGDALDGAAAADAIVTLQPDSAVMVRVADCVPILLADRRRRAVAAVHAGWKGTCAAVASATIAALETQGVPAQDLVAAIGPSIGPCCYQVDLPVREAFLRAFPTADSWFTADGPVRWRLDLWQANVDQLVASGVPAAAIHVARTCTVDHPDECFSHRREGETAGRMAAAIRIGSSEGASSEPVVRT